MLTPQLLSQISPFELRARQIVEGFLTGLHKSPYYGFSVEFAEHRPYNRGDEIRHIDWKVFGKSERYFIKQYEEETNLRCHVVLDVSSSMLFRYHGQWTKLGYGAHLAASLFYMMHKQRDACGLVTFDQDLGEMLPAKASASHLRFLLTRLEEFTKREPSAGLNRRTASAEVLHEIAERLHRRSLVIIISDLFENMEGHEQLLNALKHLRHRKHEVVLFHMLEKRSERDLDFPDGRYLFQDLETGDEMDLTPSEIRSAYKEEIDKYAYSFKMACSEAHIDYEEVDTGASFDLALLAYLNKRKRLG
ncbi:MAG: DUF58 domain-containing protein [Candidatus Cyclonatronum sp.]|uniref:DUF58 domain-containing protein n=1 Tax=Cyclonatronum sp. TaxID=3024185 RepID=UPI0025BA1A48|nr:DUF58 domain-containing protein [Cyclonatronum sp.]MCC5934056.1 DUF58 domain-containing protein [Balneolales bacterium]MCH8486443.1 DUF58 domain-containing protein [Cyclonatronum sp.]